MYVGYIPKLSNKQLSKKALQTLSHCRDYLYFPKKHTPVTLVITRYENKQEVTNTKQNGPTNEINNDRHIYNNKALQVLHMNITRNILKCIKMCKSKICTFTTISPRIAPYHLNLKISHYKRSDTHILT